MSSKCKSYGFSLVELLVSLAILSILATITVPYARVEYVRSKEIKLKTSLRNIRVAIDRFHDDCVAGNIARSDSGVSVDCFPRSLQVLVDGVESSGADGSIKYYLRRLPVDPFSLEDDDHWEVRGYKDSPDGAWSGDDVYDVRVKNSLSALNGVEYRTW